MCFSSNQVDVLHLQKGLLILFPLGCFFDRFLVTHLTNLSTRCFFVIRFLSQNRHVSAGNSTLVADGFAVLAFFEELASSSSDGFFLLRILETFVKFL